MKFILTLLIFFSLFKISSAQINQNHVYVKGYTRSDGTIVKPHYRTTPNSTNTDNFSTIRNTNPYTGQAGWVPRDDNYAYSYLSNSNGNIRKSYSKTEPLTGYGKQEYWIYNKVGKLVKKGLKKDDKFKRKLISNTKKYRKIVRRNTEIEIQNLADGWYQTMVFSNVKYKKGYEEIILKRQVLIKNGKVVKYIGNNHLAYDVYNFDKSGKSYRLKLIFPDNSIGTEYLILSFYDKEKLTYEPYYEYPSILFFYVTETNNGGKISVTLEDKNNVYWGGYIENYWNELPDCQTSQNVVKFYVPKGKYKFFAENNKSLWTNSNLSVKNNCQGQRLTFD